MEGQQRTVVASVSNVEQDIQPGDGIVVRTLDTHRGTLVIFVPPAPMLKMLPKPISQPVVQLMLSRDGAGLVSQVGAYVVASLPKPFPTWHTDNQAEWEGSPDVRSAKRLFAFYSPDDDHLTAVQRVIMYCTFFPRPDKLRALLIAMPHLAHTNIPFCEHTLFEAAVRLGNMNVARVLWELCRDECRRGYALHWAAFTGNRPVAEALLNEFKLDLNSAPPARISSVSQGMTPIAMATQNSQSDMVHWLARCNALVSGSDARGRSLLDIASSRPGKSSSRMVATVKKVLKEASAVVIAPEPVAVADGEEEAHTLTCRGCGRELPTASFSKAQRRKKKEAKCFACVESAAAALQPQPPPHMRDLNQKQLALGNERAAVWTPCQSGNFTIDHCVDGQWVLVGDLFVPTAEMDGQQMRMHLGVKTVIFRFHSVLSIMAELAAFSFLPDKEVRYLEGGWLYSLTIDDETHVPTQIFLSTAVWRKYHNRIWPSSCDTYPFPPQGKIKDTYLGKELKNLHDFAVANLKPGANVTQSSHSLAACLFLDPRTTKRLPDIEAAIDLDAKSEPRWWVILEKLWGRPWQNSVPPCMFVNTPFGCANGNKCEHEHDVNITEIIHDLKTRPRKCIVCNVFAASGCGRCKTIFYCCTACQKSHWRVHRDSCRPPEAAEP